MRFNLMVSITVAIALFAPVATKNLRRYGSASFNACMLLPLRAPPVISVVVPMGMIERTRSRFA